MSIGTFESLSNAAQGRMAPRVYTPPPPVNNVYNEALARRSNFSKTPSQLIASGKTVSTQANPVYSNILSQATRASGGLNAEGKYGGFNNAGDLQTAIEGAAISLGRTSTPQTLRAKAEAFYNKIDPMYGKASLGAQQWTRKDMGYNPQSESAASFRQFEETSQNRTAPLRGYANTLGDWYTKQTAPAENYLQSAQQLEATPLSALASQIATSAYGMNPDLAAGKFGGLDNTYYTQQRDAESIAKTGMPYAQAQDMETAAAKEQKTLPSRWAAALEQTTGFKSSAMSALTAQTPEQMYSTYSQDYTYKDPETDKEVVSNGQAIVEIMKSYLEAGENDFAMKLADSLGQQDLARILNAMYNLGPTKGIRTKQTNAIYSGT
jgi:hypothetical protein